MLCHRFIWSISSERQAPTTTVSCEFSVVFFTCDSIRQISSSTKFDKEIPEPQNRLLEVSKSPKYLKKNLNAESQRNSSPLHSKVDCNCPWASAMQSQECLEWLCRQKERHLHSAFEALKYFSVLVLKPFESFSLRGFLGVCYLLLVSVLVLLVLTKFSLFFPFFVLNSSWQEHSFFVPVCAGGGCGVGVWSSWENCAAVSGLCWVQLVCWVVSPSLPG